VEWGISNEHIERDDVFVNELLYGWPWTVSRSGFRDGSGRGTRGHERNINVQPQ
jgi:hypothetical protein